jgi:hypothetical protein
VTALAQALATGDDIGKVQRSIRCMILGLKMLIMSTINRDGMTAIGA